MNDNNKSLSDFLGEDLTKALAIALSIVILFTGGYFFGSVSSNKANDDVPVASIPAASDTTAPTTKPTEAPTVAPTESQPTVAPSENEGEEPTKAPEGNGEKSIAEIVKLYNDSANKVKGSATKVVKNFEDREFNKDTLVVPNALKSLASSVIPTFFGDDTEPIESVGAEAIKADFIVPGQDYVSAITEADVAEATCTDNGTEYEIMIKIKDETNPVPGKGVGAAFDVIETSDITESEYGSVLEKFDTVYFNCVLKCKIDKATGNMTWANYKTPLKLDIVVNMFGTHNVSLELSFEKDYNIFY